MTKNQDRYKEYLFVDGYNIINSWDDLKKIADVDLEQARIELVERMVEYHHSSGLEIIIVFDAHLVRRNLGKDEEYKGIRVVYTKEHETADHFIERTVDQLGRVRRIRVATSDWLEQQIVLSRGGTRISARELKLEMERHYEIVNKIKETENEKNKIQMGNIDGDALEALKRWGKNKSN